MLPPLALSYTTDVPGEIFGELTAALRAAGAPVEVEEREPDGPQAGVEWLISTAVFFFLGKAYFEGFVGEMGKDHYGVVKAQLKALYLRLVGPNAPHPVVVSTVGKIRHEQRYSLLYSLLAEADDGLRFKLLIPRLASEAEYEAAVDGFIDFLDAFHSRQLSAELIDELRGVRVVGRTVLLAYSHDQRRVVPIDPMDRERG